MVKNSKSIIIMGMLIALEIVLTRFVQIPIVLPFFNDRVSLGFLPVAIAGAFCARYGMLSGIAGGALVGGISDVIRAIILPQGGAFVPLFSVNAALRGGVYGAFFKGGMSFVKIILATLFIFVICNNLILSWMISFVYGTPFLTALMGRTVVSAVNMVVQLIVLCVIGMPIERKLPYA